MVEVCCIEISEQFVFGVDFIVELEVEWQMYFDQCLLVDCQLVEVCCVLEDCDIEVCKLEQQCQFVEQVLVVLCEKLFEKCFVVQVLQMCVQQLVDVIIVLGLELELLFVELVEDVDVDVWCCQFIDIGQKIVWLELVNLVVIQEYVEQSECKMYLDNQIIDFISVMEMLEGVIKKIDCEMCQCFKEIFDKVNVGVQELFLCLFGGGYVYLEFIGDDLFNIGVVIMVWLFGKCVFNILLLFGGEKVFIVVLLVFLIFGFNFVLFCLFDEVDVLLDEVNVGCFFVMVCEMSEKVQFIFISYNKVIMEVVIQLCGVIMCEFGVLCLVQVDLVEVVKLVGVV